MDIWDEKFERNEDDPYGDDPYGGDSYGDDPYGDDPYGGDFYRSDHDIGDDLILEHTWEDQQTALISKDFADECGSMPIAKPGTKEFQKEWGRKSPIERFKLQVNKVALDLTENSGTIILSKDDRNRMCRKADESYMVGTPAKYLNPLAYVLGYVVYKTGSLKSSAAMYKIFGKDFHKLQQINMYAKNDYAVFPPDVIRYGRFWKDSLQDV